MHSLQAELLARSSPPAVRWMGSPTVSFGPNCYALKAP